MNDTRVHKTNFYTVSLNNVYFDVLSDKFPVLIGYNIARRVVSIIIFNNILRNNYLQQPQKGAYTLTGDMYREKIWKLFFITFFQRPGKE